MKRWGVVISGFYAVIVAILLVPVLIGTLENSGSVSAIFEKSLKAYTAWPDILIWVVIIVGGQALLLFLSVDTAWRHAKPRLHIGISAALASFFATFLMSAAVLSILVSVYGDGLFQGGNEARHLQTALGIWVGLWAIWGVAFYRYYRNSSNPMSRVVTWLLKGSVLELLIAVPAHIIVRQRGDCSAPVVTSFGIVTGLAVMLFCFGPGVLALYKKRLDGYFPNARKTQET